MTNPVPWLRSGTGQTPADGGCIMQVVDWISTGGWTDRPECVHPAIRRLAINLNDTLDDEGRQKLLDLAPRMMGTNTGGKEMSVRLALFCAESVLHLWTARHPDDDRPQRAIGAAREWLGEPSAYATASAAAAYAANAAAYAASAADAANAADAAANAKFDLLVGLLDEYDRITGRTTVNKLDYTAVCQVMTG